MTTPNPTRRQANATLAVLTTALFAYQALESMLAPALPMIQEAVGASTPQIAWVFTGVLLAGAVATPLIGRLADVRDKRKVLLATLAITSLGTLVAALAPSVVVLTLGQLLQGAGLGLIPLAVGIIRDTQPAARIKSANGLIIGAGALSTAAGLLIAGPIVARLHYTWLFWIPLAILVLTMIGAWRFVPSCPPVRSGRVDIAGAVLLGGGLAALLVGLTLASDIGWLSAGFLGILAGSLLLLAAFVVVELRTAEPLVDLRLLAGRSVLLVCAVSLAVGFGTFAVFLIVPTIVQMPAATGYGLGATATITGLFLMPLGVGGTLTAPLAGRLEKLLGARGVMVLGTAAIAGSCLVLLGAAGRPWVIVIATALAGVGIGLGLTQAMNIVVTTVPPQRTGAVSGIALVVKSVGGTLGAQIGASILAADVIPGTPAPTWHAMEIAFWTSAAVGAVAVVLSLALPARLAPFTAAVVPKATEPGLSA